MKDTIQFLLKISAELYQYLAEIPKSEDRDKYIEEINRQLDERGLVVENLRHKGFTIDASNKTHIMLVELDKGIRERMNSILEEIKSDMKDIQNQKKNEKQYMNPYSDVRVMDGMYYDKKK